MFDTFGNKVWIKRTKETEEKGLADKEGEVHGQTSPSMMDFKVTETLTEGVALNVHFDRIDKKWTKGKNGGWIEENTMVLEYGSLLIMGKGCQDNFKHSLPVNTLYKSPRINLIFRKLGFDD
ncbi:MAG: hypothetical protein JKY48_19240 [Flavobacteriales bacterium]|nr:hypothetical protein [Flavobacteriales bacterium]